MQLVSLCSQEQLSQILFLRALSSVWTLRETSSKDYAHRICASPQVRLYRRSRNTTSEQHFNEGMLTRVRVTLSC